MEDVKAQLYNDNFQNYKRYSLPKAQLVIADIPYNIGVNAYGSNPAWYKGGDRKNGESDKAGKAFFGTDGSFNIAEYFHFCSRLLKKEPKERGQAPCMVVFCSFQQLHTVIQYGERYGFSHHMVIDPCAGSGSTLRAAKELRRESYGFEVSRPLYQRAVREMLDFQNNQLCFLDFMEGA